MTKKVFITGDCHGRVVDRIENIIAAYPEVDPKEMMIIIAGDAGINFWLNKTDKRNKKDINEYGCLVYCVRGNHEERPENIVTYHTVYDDNVCGDVYIEDEYPNIRFFMDGGEYYINGHRVLTIGGAYSIDKWYRLNRCGVFSIDDENYKNAKKTGWFPDEMLYPGEMMEIFHRSAGRHYDFVISHTAPIGWEPQDLFLGFVKQDEVDKSMESFLEDLKNNISYGVWIFGHYHANRIEKPYVEQYYTYFEDMEIIWKRWGKYRQSNELDWYIIKSPNFYN